MQQETGIRRYWHKWLDDGAPLGFTEDIPTTGVFPAVQGPSASAEAIKGMTRTLEDWQNY